MTDFAKNGDHTKLNNAIIKGIQEKKGSDIVSLNLQVIPDAVADYFIICHANSSTQVKAISDSIEEIVKKELGINAWSTEGKLNAQWVLLDYSTTVVHVFMEQFRELYDIEALWNDAERIDYENMI